MTVFVCQISHLSQFETYAQSDEEEKEREKMERGKKKLFPYLVSAKINDDHDADV